MNKIDCFIDNNFWVKRSLIKDVIILGLSDKPSNENTYQAILFIRFPKPLSKILQTQRMGGMSMLILDLGPYGLGKRTR